MKQQRTLTDQVKDKAVDVRNEAIVQSANLYLFVRRFFLASLGAAAMTADEASEILNRMVERGEIAESEFQKLMSDLRTRGSEGQAELKSARDETVRRAGEAVEESFESILARLNVPSRSDIEEMNRQISALGEKISALKERERD